MWGQKGERPHSWQPLSARDKLRKALWGDDRPPFLEASHWEGPAAAGPLRARPLRNLVLLSSDCAGYDGWSVPLCG